MKQQKEEYETGLEGALEEALNKYREQSDYWKDKVRVLEGQFDRAKVGSQISNEEVLFRMK